MPDPQLGDYVALSIPSTAPIAMPDALRDGDAADPDGGFLPADRARALTA